MRVYSISWFVAGFAAALLVSAGLDMAYAGSRYGEDLSRGYVVTESVMGGGHVAGRVRRTRLGAQVRLPGGTWIYCERSCAETLRANTVDFWEAQAPDGSAGPQGVLIYVWPR